MNKANTMFYMILLVILLGGSIFAKEGNKELSQSEKKEVLDSLISKMKKAYVFLDKAEEVEKFVRSKEYSNDPGKLAGELHDDVRNITKDLHLSIYFSPPTKDKKKVKRKELTPEEEEEQYRKYIERLKKTNYTFSKVEILPGNFGYFNLGGFIATDGAFRAAAAAFQFVENCDAIIIDVRNNGGGDGRMGHFLSTYFFADGDSKWLLNNYNRGQNKLVQEWTMPTTPGKRFPDTPLYILINGRTFSAAEAFPYGLQAYGRAILVGDTTGGGAHSVGSVNLAHGVGIRLPSGRVTSPVTESNWEGIGVLPDIPAEDGKEILRVKEHYYKNKLENAESEDEKQYLKLMVLEMEAEFNPVELDEKTLVGLSGEYLVENSSGKTRIIYHKEGKLFLKLIDGGNELFDTDIKPLSKSLFKFGSEVKLEFSDFANEIPSTLYWVRGNGSKEKWVRK